MSRGKLLNIVAYSPFVGCIQYNAWITKPARVNQEGEHQGLPHTAPEEDAGLISTSIRNSSRIQKFYVYASLKSIKEKNLQRGPHLRCFSLFFSAKGSKIKFFLLKIVKNTSRFQILQKIMIIKENRFLVQICTKIRSLCRFFYFLHFLVAFALKLNVSLEFLLETKIKPGSSFGEVCPCMVCLKFRAQSRGIWGYGYQSYHLKNCKNQLLSGIPSSFK